MAPDTSAQPPLHARDGDAVHPRPQLRRDWTDLSGPWSYACDDADVGRLQGWVSDPAPFDRTIQVPFPPESPASGIGEQGFHPVVWYRRGFTCAPPPGMRVLLHFGAVDHSAEVWVNGGLVARHEGGHTPFSADVTGVLRPDGHQEVVVRAQDRPGDLQQPRGKQDWLEEPHNIWYHRTTGIWQPVWFEVVPDTRVEAVEWTPDVQCAALRGSIGVRRTDDRPLRLRLRVSLGDVLLADEEVAVLGEEVRREVALPQHGMSIGRKEVLWAPEHPNLMDVVIELLDADGVVDRVESYAAVRSATATDGRFELNGQPYFLRLVLAQGYWPESHLAAPSAGALRREVELVKSLGFNGVRVHQKIEDPRFLYWCDRLGLMVWAEMPSAYEFSGRSVSRTAREWIEVVERDRSHPCIIAWVPVNESWGVPSLRDTPAQQDFVRAVYHLTRALDPTRPVIGNDGWEQVVTDILTVHDYSSRGDVLRERYGDHAAVDRTLRTVQPGYRSVLLPGTERQGQPVMVTEFGGITLAGADGPDGVWNGYGQVPHQEAFLARYRDLVEALLDSPAVMGFCYTQLTDTVQEKNGLLYEDRRSKLPVEALRAVNCRTSAAVPADAIGSFEFGDYPVPLGERAEASGD